MQTIKLSAEKRNHKLQNLQPVDKVFQEALQSPLEDYKVAGTDIYDPGCHALLGAVQTAFAYHLPLRLTPDHIWVTITKGLADHIERNAEELRSKFVNFEGKQTIDIRRDHFVKGRPNDWESCFSEFSQKIKEYIGEENHKRIISNFSTTDKLSLAVSEVVLMDAMKGYFNYSVTTCCGIPEIILEGAVEDWRQIKKRFDEFVEYGLDWWVSELSPILDEFVKAMEGNPNISFWENFYSEGGGSGGPHISGHIVKFYPYTKYDINKFRSITSGQIPRNWSSVPFVWDYLGTKYTMQFVAGMVGIKQLEDFSVTPEFSWAVREASISLGSFAVEKLYVGMKVYDKDGNCGILKNAQIDTTEWGGKKEVKIDWCLFDFSGKEEKVYYYDFTKYNVR